MSDVRLYLFPPFRYEVRTQRLWNGSQRILLRPKSRAVLLYLLERRDRVVGRQELFDGVWGKIRVSDAVLKISIREIRHALGDNSQVPKFIETVHKTGYRFIGRLKTQNDRDKQVEPERLSGPFDGFAPSDPKTANLPLAIDERKKSAYEAAAARSVSLLLRSFDGDQNGNYTFRSFVQSAQRAIFRRAYKEAVSYCTRALGILASVPESSRRNQLELRLSLLVGLLLGAAPGGTARAGEAISRAEVLLATLSTDAFLSEITSELFFLVSNF